MRAVAREQRLPDGPSYITTLALIYAWTDEKDLALEQLATSARIPGGITYGELKLNPQWDSLRGDSRFEQSRCLARTPHVFARETVGRLANLL